MAILYENPREVGADRIVNAVAAFERAKGPVIVVDFGTATTFDCVTPKGEYLGGVIAPGIQISADALFARAAKLPRVEIAKPPHVIGRNTHPLDPVGHRLRLRGARGRRRRTPHARSSTTTRWSSPRGLARLIAPLSTTIAEAVDELTLEGLRLIHERNPLHSGRA